MFARHSLLVCGLILVLALAGPAGAQGGLASFKGSDPLVLAIYYPWYDENTWSSGLTADQPLIPYASREPEAIERHVGWGKDAGIDAFVTAWFGPRDDNPTETNFRQLLDAGLAKGLRGAVLVETDSDTFFPDRAALVTGLRHALDVHAAHPAYLRVDDRPVIFVWSPRSVFAPGGGRVNANSPAAVAAWASILDEVDPARRALWIAEGEYTGVLDVFDGLFPFSIAWAASPAGQLQSYAGRVRQYNASNGTDKRWIATAMPGYDDTRLPGRGRTFAVDRADGAYYDSTFRGAIATSPSWIVITSFNEWMEGHLIEPAVSYGTKYLDLTRTLAAEFKTR